MDQQINQFQPPLSQEANLPQKKPSQKELKKEALRQRKIVKEVLYPLVLKHAKTVKDAKTMLHTIVIGLDAVFMMDMKKYSEFRSGDRLETLKLKGFMNEGESYAGEWAIVEALKDEKIAGAKGLIEGLEKELNRLTERDEKAKPLSELKTEFL